ncbi:MAG TPA: DUF72 domain-containing protein [Longimicrobiales bacterium]|nr:DUF72 domain-containing protein [Longimicrobiales bacterium]
MHQDKPDEQLGLFPSEEPGTAWRAVAPAAPPPGAAEVAERLPPGVRLGASSWSFPGWHGTVYDRPVGEATLAREGLHAYAAHPLLRTVGLDRTRVRPLPATELRGYAASVPADFRFVVEADRLVTSPLDPEPFGTRAPNPRFLDASYAADAVVGPVVEGLGDRAGPILFQIAPFPPNLVGGRSRFLRRLERFLQKLPEGPVYAVELRAPALLTEAYAQVLEATGAAHCFNVHPSMSPLERQLALIQPFYQPVLLVRWTQRAGMAYEAARERYAPFDRLVEEDPATREIVATTVLDAALGEREAYVLADNEAEGSAPLTLFRLAERIAGWSPLD